MNEKFRLDGKTALVTGAADGIGWSIAECFARSGARVAVSDVNGELCHERGDALRNVGCEAWAATCDVADTASVERWVAEAFNRFGGVDILVNNAAVAISGDTRKMPEADWTQVLNTNLTSSFRTIQRVLPSMIERGGGSIVNIGSAQAKRSWPNWTAYASAKGGLLAMTRQLAGQFGSYGIRVNLISPGAINTPLNQRRAEEEGEAFLESSRNMHALGRMGEPEEVAAAALFLASNAASFVTGVEFPVDGGLSVLPRYIEGKP